MLMELPDTNGPVDVAARDEHQPMQTAVAIQHEVFPKIARWSRDIIITEKLDGTNAQIYVAESGQVFAGSRNRWLAPESDNFGFARWVKEHEAELREGLGPGRHFGEWWGLGIQRGYGLREKRFSLFNVHRWTDSQYVSEGRSLGLGREQAPALVSVVPVIYYGPLTVETYDPVYTALEHLRQQGSQAVPGFMRPEGIVIYHTTSRTSFKKTLENDEKGKEQ